MKIITFLLSLALLSLGFAGGVAFITIFTKDTIKQLRLENRLLKRQKKDTVEVIYSTGFDGETTVDPPEDYCKNLFDPF